MIVCLGTTPALARTMQFDRVAIDGVSRATDVHEYAAGKAVNAARAAAALGELSVCVGVSGGATGARLRALLDAASIAHDFVDVATPTRLCVTVIDRSAGTSTELVEPSGPVTIEEGERVLDAFARALPGTSTGARACVLGGSLAPGLADEFYARCVAACRAAGVPVILDASGPPLRAALAARPDVVKINAGELATVAPLAGEDDAAVTEAATALAAATGGWVIVTRGRASTIAAHASRGALVVAVPAVRVVSAIGSGDSFAGGLAVAVARGLAMAEGLRLATACASANAMTPHAAHFDVAEVERLRASIDARPSP